MKKTLVTVYITNYNYDKYIETAILSVLNQTFKDYELIIIDDGSTDNSDKIVEKYEKLDKVYVIKQQNKGLTFSSNLALKLSKAEYIMRLDADDYLKENALETMVECLNNNPGIALVFPDYYTIDENGEIIERVKRHDFNKDVSLFDFPAHGACTMIRRKVLMEIGGYDERFTRQDGYDLWLSIIRDYQVTNINYPLFYYRQHSKSLTKNEKLLLKTRSEILEKHVLKNHLPSLVVLCIIPVRGSSLDSRSLPLENLGGKKLIDWTIEAALKSKKLINVVVTSPDDSILDYISKYHNGKILCHKRNVELARINVRLVDSLINAISYYQEKLNAGLPDAVLVLNIESPFRSEMYIDKAINVMQIYNVDIVAGVREDNSFFYFHDGTGLKTRKEENGLRLERDDLYKKVGGMTLVKTRHLLDKKNMISGKIGHIILDQLSAFSLESELDWKIGEYLSTLNKNVSVNI